MTRAGVAIVTHNSAGHIEACLRSLAKAAPGVPIDVVVVDNNSGDGTADLVRRAWPHIRVIPNPHNVGFARGVNAAARALEGCSHLLLLNPDATMTAGSLAIMLAALDASPAAAACGPHLRYPDGRHQISARPLPTLASTVYDALLLYHLKSRPDFVEQFPADGSVMEVECLSGACMLIRRDVFDRLQGMDERFFLYGEDMDFSVRLRQLGRTQLLVPAAEVRHVEGASAFRDRAAFFREIHRARALYARKHFGAVKSVLAVAAQTAGLVLRGALYPLGAWFGRPDLKAQAWHQWVSIPRALGFRRR